MNTDKDRMDKIKRTIRNLKKSELRIRFNGDAPSDDLVWKSFFSYKPDNNSARYTIKQIASMDKDEYKNIIEEFYWAVYYKLFKESYYNSSFTFDVDSLKKLGLSPLSDFNEIKSRFRELAKKYHPDAGGSNEEFLELYKIYKELKEQSIN